MTLNSSSLSELSRRREAVLAERQYARHRHRTELFVWLAALGVAVVLIATLGWYSLPPIAALLIGVRAIVRTADPQREILQFISHYKWTSYRRPEREWSTSKNSAIQVATNVRRATKIGPDEITDEHRSQMQIDLPDLLHIADDRAVAWPRWLRGLISVAWRLLLITFVAQIVLAVADPPTRVVGLFALAVAFLLDLALSIAAGCGWRHHTPRHYQSVARSVADWLSKDLTANAGVTAEDLASQTTENQQ